MALPFLNKRKDGASISGVIMKQRAPDEASDTIDSDAGAYSLEDCAKDILAAVQSNDSAALADALREAIETAQNEPDESEEAPEPHSYDAQNQGLGQE